MSDAEDKLFNVFRHFYMKVIKHTEKMKEFYSEYPLTHR